MIHAIARLAVGRKGFVLLSSFAVRIEAEIIVFSRQQEGKMIEKFTINKLANTRDLGGIKTADGRTIACKRLIRSGMLSSLSPEDVEVLKSLEVHTIVDFRDDKEVEEKPDVEIEGIENIHIPVLPGPTEGLSHDSKSDESLTERLDRAMVSEDAAIALMQGLYRALVTSPQARERYGRFIDLLLDNESGAVLYHCTVGKDRVGVGTALVLLALGVDQETVLDNYMETTRIMEPVADRMLEGIPEQVRTDTFVAAFKATFAARPEYLGAALEEIEKEFDSLDEFLEKAIGVTEEKRSKLRDLYLE